jgi:ketosteroid isomerase-like protein
MRLLAALAVVLLLVPISAAQLYSQPSKTSTEMSVTTLRQTELDFAKAFAERNVARFAEFVADDARFTAAAKVREGKAAILEQWTRMMQNPDLTLTWSPDIVELSQAGDLGFTSGPYEATVKQKDGTIARERGRFASVWRRQANGRYQIIFDIGSPEEGPAPKP